MSGVPPFTAGELVAVITATNMAHQVASMLVTATGSAQADNIVDDLAGALAKLHLMADTVIDDDQREGPHGTTDHL